MGYDMHTSVNGEYFRANIWGMGLLRDVMFQAGVDFNKKKDRHTQLVEDQDGNKHGGNFEHGSILICFGSNDGWHVDEEDCREIAEKLSGFNSRHYVSNKYMDGAVKGLEKLADSMPDSVGDHLKNMFKQEKKHLSEDDLDFIQEFAAYCKKAADLGGFYVW